MVTRSSDEMKPYSSTEMLRISASISRQVEHVRQTDKVDLVWTGVTALLVAKKEAASEGRLLGPWGLASAARALEACR